MKTRFLTLIIIIVSLILIIGSVFAEKNKKSTDITSSGMPGFTRISSIQGVSFYVNSMFTDTATAITQVSGNTKFFNNQYYSYRDGTDKYLLFNMEKLVVAAQKDTDFRIGSSNDKEFSLQNANIMNIWFTKGSKKFESSTKDGVTITTVNAGVTINPTTYGDFCGKLINIEKDGTEWSLFVGVPGERYDKLSDNSRKGIETIIDTFAFSDDADLISQDIYAVSVSGYDGTKQDVKTEEAEVDPNSVAITTSPAIVDKDEELAYSSSPYNMLSIGDNGLLSAFNDYTTSYEKPIVCPTDVITGKDAIAIIKRFCSATNQYEFINAPEGSSWVVIRYNVNYQKCENKDYINTKVKGVDGEVLRYRGIKYPERTYDMDFETSERDFWVDDYYSYFAVPNGCEDFCIEFGESESVNGDEVEAAYYYVSLATIQGTDAEEDIYDAENTEINSIEDLESIIQEVDIEVDED